MAKPPPKLTGGAGGLQNVTGGAGTIKPPFKEIPISKTTLPTKPVKPPGKTTGVGTGVSKDDPYGGLVGADRDAAVAITNLFKSYGLDSLAPQIVKMIQNGYSADTISILLQDTPEYKQRFAANAARLKAGLPVLSPAEYISTEQSYRQIMSAAGLPVGFYDNVSDFQSFLEKDISPTEVQSRVNTAAEAINKAPPETIGFFKQWYSSGDMIAYALDPTVAQPLIEQRIKAAESAAVAAKSGLSLTQANAEDIGRTGSSLGDIQSGLSFVAQESKTTDKLSQLYGGAVTQDDLVQEVFDSNAEAAMKRRKLASRERGAFSGSTAQSKTSLSESDGGAF
jgi:hypothetical protein